METRVNPYRTPGAVVEDRDQGEREKLSLPQIWFSFAGRIPRKVYWLYFFLPLILLSMIAGAVVGATAPPGERDPGSMVALVLQVLLIWPSLAVSAKRWHDRDKSAWWILVGLIPIIGNIWILIENGFLRGTEGSNRFGDDPTGLY